MIVARVAAVPNPRSFMASESSFSSSVFPADSIAVSSVASVNRFGGRVFLESASTWETRCGWPCASPGGILCAPSPSEGEFFDEESSRISSAVGFRLAALLGGARSSTFQPSCSTDVPGLQ